MAGGARESGRSVTSKVTAILLVFSRGSSYSLTELAQLAGLPISTAHRLAGELTARRILERTEDRDYRIGLPLRTIGAGPVAGPSGPQPLLRRAAGVLGDLAAATGSTVRLGMLDGRVVVETVTRPGRAGTTGFRPSAQPPGTSALGRALLAFSPPEVVAHALGGAPVPDGLRRCLGVTRLTRFALRRDDAAGGGAVAMPVFGAGGVLLAAVEVGVGDLRDGLWGARAALVVATGSLSRQLATADPVDPAATVAG